MLLLPHVILQSCEKPDSNSTNRPNKNSTVCLADSCTKFEHDTTDLDVTFCKTKLLGHWELEKIISLYDCFTSLSSDSFIEKGILVSFYDEDSLAASYINEYSGIFEITGAGKISITDWGGTKINNTEWERMFNRTIKNVDLYYITDSILVLFEEEYKLKLLKTQLK